MEINKSKDKVIIKIDNLSSEEAIRLRTESQRLFYKDKIYDFEIDLSKLYDINTVLLGVLTSINRLVKDYGGSVVLSGIGIGVALTLEKTRLHKIFKIK